VPGREKRAVGRDSLVEVNGETDNGGVTGDKRRENRGLAGGGWFISS